MPNRFASQIRSKIDDKREVIVKLDRERDRLRAELAAYEEMLILAEDDDQAGTEDSGTQNNGEMHHSSRGLSAPWKAIMKRLAARDRFNFDDAVREAVLEGIDSDKKGMRSRMHSYATSGYVERIDDGIFRVTPKGMAR